MYLSIFSDELGLDVEQALPIIRSWGLEWVDFRGRVFGKAIETLSADELAKLKGLVDSLGFKVGVIQSSLAKVHLPDADRQRAEAAKLEGIIRAADALECRVVRSFHYWQPKDPELKGQLAVRPDELQKVVDMFAPLAKRAREAGLQMTFENCGVTPFEVFTVLDAMGEKGWGLAWDVRNGWDLEERKADQAAFIKKMVSRSKVVHVKARGALPELGGDVIPYDEVLQACDDGGIQGAVSVETHNPDRMVSNEEMSKRVVEAMQKAWPSAAPGFSGGEEPVREGVTRPWADDPVGMVVVGLGMGHNRSKMILNTPGARLVGVCDLVEERAQRTGEECGVPYSTNVEDWLKRDDVEAVFVVTETGNHASVAIQALEAGKHVISTKPMEANLAAAERMVQVADEKGLVLAIDFSRRYLKRNQELKTAIDGGTFGRLLGGTCFLKILRTKEYYDVNGGWHGTIALDGGGVLSNQAVHHIDELVYALGAPARVKCELRTQTHDIEGEDYAAAVWEYENGPVVTLSATTSYPHSTWYYTLELHGTEAAYHKSGGGFVEKELVRWYTDGAWGDAAPNDASCEWMNSVDNFAAAIRTGAPLLADGRAGARTQAVLEAMYRSGRELGGAWADVPAGVPAKAGAE